MIYILELVSLGNALKVSDEVAVIDNIDYVGASVCREPDKLLVEG
jgi:hypothetical protein